VTLAGLALGLLACSPALDWRQVRPEDSRVSMMFPCKPVTQARRLLLAGQEVRMTLHVCSAGGQTWALSWADVGDPARLGDALAELQRSAAANIGADVAQDAAPLSVRGATPHPGSTRQHLRGSRPDGRPVALASAAFAYGTVVYQATALGETLPDAAVQTFIGALQVGG
jgi:hypothetical protein